MQLSSAGLSPTEQHFLLIPTTKWAVDFSPKQATKSLNTQVCLGILPWTSIEFQVYLSEFFLSCWCVLILFLKVKISHNRRIFGWRLLRSFFTLNAMDQISVQDKQHFLLLALGKIWPSTCCVPCGN